MEFYLEKKLNIIYKKIYGSLDFLVIENLSGQATKVSSYAQIFENLTNNRM